MGKDPRTKNNMNASEPLYSWMSEEMIQERWPRNGDKMIQRITSEAETRLMPCRGEGLHLVTFYKVDFERWKHWK